MKCAGNLGYKSSEIATDIYRKNQDLYDDIYCKT